MTPSGMRSRALERSVKPETDRTARYWIWGGLAAVLGVALGLRLWGIAQGLPFAYNLDEETLFVPRAVAMSSHSLNPHHFENPPAFTYLLHFLLVGWLGDHQNVARVFHLHPARIYTFARVVVAILGTGAIWLLYLTGARLFSRGVGLLSAALMSVAFLPVFYSHLALNDVPTLVPITLALFGCAGVVNRGRLGDYLLAAVGVGLASATKYTGGIVLLSLAAACAVRVIDGDRRARVAGLAALAGGVALATFVAADPYSLIALKEFRAGITHQSTLSAEVQGKLGAPKGGGIRYYLWSFTWGLGWLPSLGAALGAAAVVRRAWRAACLLLPASLAFLLFMGLQTRYFGRWLLPLFPIACLLGAYFAMELSGWIAKGLAKLAMPSPRPIAVALVLVAMCIQGFIYSVHAGLVLSRPYTSELTRRWMVAHVPLNTRIVVEPVVPNAWLEYTHELEPQSAGGARYRWIKLPALVNAIAPDGTKLPNPTRVGIEDYERTLRPSLLPYYQRLGYCWVVTGSTQSGRAFANPTALPEAVSYYRALAAQAEVAYRASPYAVTAKPPHFSFDWSFDYYPLAYIHPGPDLTVYRLRGGRCGPEHRRSD
jgi:4-amino-4-deoxy-L-arabinose transferase-like glycosyltransferase